MLACNNIIMSPLTELAQLYSACKTSSNAFERSLTLDVILSCKNDVKNVTVWTTTAYQNGEGDTVMHTVSAFVFRKNSIIDDHVFSTSCCRHFQTLYCECKISQRSCSDKIYLMALHWTLGKLNGTVIIAKHLFVLCVFGNEQE